LFNFGRVEGELTTRAVARRTRAMTRTLTLLSFVLVFPSLALAQPATEPPVEPSPRLAPPPPESPPEPPAVSVDLEAVLHGEGRGMTADAAAELAIETAPGVERAEAARRQASAGALRALNGFIPQLALTARYTRLSEIQNGSVGGGAFDPDLIDAITADVDDPEARFLWRQTLGALSQPFPILLNSFAFQVSLTVPLSDMLLQVLPAYESAQAREEAAELQVSAQRREVGLSAREAFYQYARARASLAVARSSLEQAETRHRQVEAFVEAGTAARVDELRIRAQVAAARVAVVRAEAGVRLAGAGLRTLLHLEPQTELAVGEDLLAPMPAVEGDLEALVSTALSQRDDVRAIRRLIESAGRAVDAAEGSRYPHLILRGNLDIQNPNQRVFPQTEEFRESWDVSAVLQWSPSDVITGEAQANEARAQQDQARADLRQLRDGIRVTVIEAATNYFAASESLSAARLGVEAADESYRVTKERYRAGAATVSDTIDASSEQIRAQLDLVNAAIDARIAHARLQRSIGASEE